MLNYFEKKSFVENKKIREVIKDKKMEKTKGQKEVNAE